MQVPGRGKAELGGVVQRTPGTHRRPCSTRDPGTCPHWCTCNPTIVSSPAHLPARPTTLQLPGREKVSPQYTSAIRTGWSPLPTCVSQPCALMQPTTKRSSIWICVLYVLSPVINFGRFAQLFCCREYNQCGCDRLHSQAACTAAGECSAEEACQEVCQAGEEGSGTEKVSHSRGFPSLA